MTLSTPDLCDRYPDEVKIVEPMFRSYGGKPRFSGPVVTVKCFEDNSRIVELLEQPGEGRVIVADGAGSLHRALLGDRLAALAATNGWSGLLIYGCVRDVELLRDIDLGILAVNSCPRKTTRQGHGRLDVPLNFAGVTFSPGEYLYADENGVIIAGRSLED